MKKNAIAEKAVILNSGGLDSTTCLAIAAHEGYRIYSLSFDYGQRHKFELQCARTNADTYGAVKHCELKLALDSIVKSELTGTTGLKPENGIPPTYVPSRNIIFLSVGSAWAESLGAGHLFTGVNAVDFSGYPDCRPAFINAFQNVLLTGTKSGAQGKPVQIHTPLIDMKKSEIINMGFSLGVDYSRTSTCYNPASNGTPCGVCESCDLRLRGFEEAGQTDPRR